MEEKTFVELFQLGEVDYNEMDDYIDKWHNEYQGNLKLHEYLGMSWEEYKQCFNKPSELKRMFPKKEIVYAKQLIKLAKQLIND